MHSIRSSSFSPVVLSLSIGLAVLPCAGLGQTATASGGNATATGGSATAGSAEGGSATGGSATGGSATGGSVRGGSATGGSAAGGTATGGAVTAGKVSPGIATAHIGGREIKASAASSVSVSSQGENAVVSVDGHTLTIERERLVLDGKERGKLPTGASRIEVEAAQGRLSVQADGKGVLNTELERAE